MVHTRRYSGVSRWGVCLGLVLLGLIACGRDDTPKESAPTATAPTAQSTPASSGKVPQILDVTVSFVTPRFRPDPIVVPVGEPVQFRITSADTRHTFIIEALGIDVEVPQKSLDETVLTKVVTPQETGTFRITCRIHERFPMEGTLEVTATGAGR